MLDMHTFQAGSKPLNSQTENEQVTKFTPNILPCRIHHDGPIESPDRFWITQTDEQDGHSTAHFRGRRLRGRRVAVPEGYQGVIATPTERTLPVTQQSNSDSMGDGESEPEESVKILDAQGTFDEMMVWGHENLPAADDTFVKGVEEWIRFAETVSFASLACMLQISGVGLIGNTDAWSIDDNEKMENQSDVPRADPETLIAKFQIDKLLKQDQNGRRISLLGTIDKQQGILTAERAAFATESLEVIQAFHSAISRVKNLGDNDIYRWYLASSTGGSGQTADSQQDLKLNLIWPCTAKHIKKYSDQQVRMVTETPEIYREYVRPFMQAKREEGHLNWVFNILEGRTEQEDVIMRDAGQGPEDAFLMLPDLNWDRKTMNSLHLLALVHRRDIWSLRDLQKKHIPWLKYLRQRVLEATVKMYPGLEEDQLKLYVHYQPTYYHFHIHVVNVMLEAGATQATGKAFGLENIISQLETMSGGDDVSMADVSLTYYLGEASELWTDIYAPLKTGLPPVRH
ncbi:hypothetical protein POX_d05855 [Penicillium oxalicum]|uniref:hypothetical protein n=1 Tax=Penicillium oxalicum TaxID=69781 RepID=UPI0020B6E43B|nr:hypothetical protein POX_d05855 [Penicillium oxalicum]KAI2790345.1 hypothetical protein POX_d05855 [Penicillium oxalicum]